MPKFSANVKLQEINIKDNQHQSLANLVAKDFEEYTFEISKGIYFSDDIWDFSKQDELHNRHDLYVYKFNDIEHLSYKILLKKTIMREVFVKQNRHTSCAITFADCKLFVLFLEEKYPYILPSMINNDILKEYLLDKLSHLSEKIKNRTLSNIKKFIKEMEFEYEEIHLSDFDDVFNTINYTKISLQNELGKTPNIPRNLFNKIIQLALEDIENDDLGVLDKMISCMILLLSQTGMRRGELILIEKNRLKEIAIANSEKKACYLEFLTFKTTGNKTGKWTETWLNEIGVKSYNTLSKITQKRSNNTPFLYTNDKGLQYNTSTFTKHVVRFFIRHQQNLNFHLLNDTELKQVQPFTITKQHIKNYQSLGLDSSYIGKTFYKVNPHQFRVAVANELKAKGISIQWIKNHMNHLEEEMTKHYFRDDKNIKETLFRRSLESGESLATKPDEVIHNEIKNELQDPKLLEAYNSINKFLKKNKLNIFKDIDEIINILKHSPIRETELGFCTKSLGILCERQEKLETFERWYYVRPQFINIDNFDFTFKRLVDKMKVVEHNKKVAKENLKHTRQYELESATINKFYIDKFLPEFNALKNEIFKGGVEKVISQYPNLKDIVMKIDEIEKENEKWFQMQKSEKL